MLPSETYQLKSLLLEFTELSNCLNLGSNTLLNIFILKKKAKNKSSICYFWQNQNDKFPAISQWFLEPISWKA